MDENELIVNERGWLTGPNVVAKPGRWVTSGPDRCIGGTMRDVPTGIVMHYTATRDAAGAIATLNGSRGLPASAHIVLNPDGRIYQLYPFDTICWHAGDGKLPDGQNPNLSCVGIEMVNYGWCDKTNADGAYRNYERTHVVPLADCIYSEHAKGGGPMYWPIYPEAQVMAAYDIVEALCEAYPIEDIYGHDELARHKMDPGPAFGTYMAALGGLVATHNSMRFMEVKDG